VDGIHTQLVLAVRPGMGGDEGPLMSDLDRSLRAPVDFDGAADVGRWHGVAIGLQCHQAIGGHLPTPHGVEVIRGPAVMGAPPLLQKRLCRLAEDGAMQALIGHRHHPRLRHRVQRVPGRKLAAHDEAALDVLAYGQKTRT
jgi:hypothetical protein